jgi:DNA-binding NarL/FixJ family response regulator
MWILFIGNQSLQNDAIKSILSSKIDREIWHLTHAQIQNGMTITKECLVSLVDLVSFPEQPVEYVQYLKGKNLSKYLVALYPPKHDELNDALVEAGADYCFSIDSEPEELIQTISQLVDK